MPVAARCVESEYDAWSIADRLTRRGCPGRGRSQIAGVGSGGGRRGGGVPGCGLPDCVVPCGYAT